MKTSRIALIVLALGSITIAIHGQTKSATDVWQPLRFFVGKWAGPGNGEPGQSKTQQSIVSL